jgi:RimJ/RimL family protein N-acetyltransferase
MSTVDPRPDAPMTGAVQRLNEGARAMLAAHFLALPVEDRRLRFGASLSAESIAGYVDRIDFDRDAVFGIFDDDLTLIGVAHTAFAEDFAELGISVLPTHRGRRAGTALFARAAEHVRNRSISNLFMHCLSENAAIMHIARKSGMSIVAAAGDVDAHLTLSPANSASITGEFLTDRVALYDYALKANIAAWKAVTAAWEGVNAPLEGAPPVR